MSFRLKPIDLETFSVYNSVLNSTAAYFCTGDVHVWIQLEAYYCKLVSFI